MAKPDEQTFTVRVAAPVERVWQELTRTDRPQPFYFGSRLAGPLAPGAPLRYVTPDGRRVLIRGTVLDVTAPARFAHTFQFTHLREEPSEVAFTLRADGAATTVTVTHTGAGPRHRRATARGWPFVLRNLAAWVETGRLPLRARVRLAVMRPFLLLAPRDAGTGGAGGAGTGGAEPGGVA